GTANFAYKPFLDLEVGLHKVWAIAEDDSGRKSGVSNILEFLVQKPMPAPTLFSPVVNSRTKYNQPFIVGLSKNDSFIKVFIDNELNGQFEVDNHSSGTANFAFKPPVLARGNHSVYATATDNRGKESRRSNTVYFWCASRLLAREPEKKRAD
ncbi:MAG: hypothetical protein PHP21_04475, partial [Patescibacteria group bacterium]|nr:hypothetical protein [Patescibacteria group bacterium]